MPVRRNLYMIMNGYFILYLTSNSKRWQVSFKIKFTRSQELSNESWRFSQKLQWMDEIRGEVRKCCVEIVQVNNIMELMFNENILQQPTC